MPTSFSSEAERQKIRGALAACPQCGHALVCRRRRSDGTPFHGCAAYPACRYSSPLPHTSTRQEQLTLAQEAQGLHDREREVWINWAQDELANLHRQLHDLAETSARDLARLRRQADGLLDENLLLRLKVLSLETQVQIGASRAGGLPTSQVATRLKALIALVHPDKWPGNPLAHEAAAGLNALRADVMKGGAA